jgi:hypothetical protein
VPTVIKLLSPGLPEFLYALSKSDGADQTLGAQYGGAAARNGEPFGELGLILQQDPAWGDQQGSPRDPQSGNIPGGPRDVRVTSGNKTIRSPASTVTLAGAAMTLDPGTAQPAKKPTTLGELNLGLVISEAKAYWVAELGAGDARVSALDQVSLSVSDLGGLTVGYTEGTVVLLDPTAAGYGWFLSGALNGRVDLLTVVRHEFGHAIGFEHEDAGEHAIMGDTITLLRPGGATSSPTSTSSGSAVVTSSDGSTGVGSIGSTTPSSIGSAGQEPLIGPVVEATLLPPLAPTIPRRAARRLLGLSESVDAAMGRTWRSWRSERRRSTLRTRTS